ncbi:MAG: DNA repair protein RecN [Rhodothermales bacterium]|nr:DNA repair protein RecN [Rhodothermales bacterium]
MLRSLHIRDFALIEDLKVSFGPGLNIITGETGAGKSILIGALKMILGERALKDVIRVGAEKSVIEGVFDHVDSEDIRALLSAAEVEWQPLLVVRREISASQSRAFINDTPTTATALRDVADHLIDLHGQHEHQSLLRTETHVDLLDNFGNLSDTLDEYSRAFKKAQNVSNELERMSRRKGVLAERRELFEYQIAEIDRVGPVADEEAKLQREQEVLENTERLSELAARLHETLYDSDGSVYERLGEAMRDFADLIRIDRELETTFSEIESAKVVVDEVSRTLSNYASSLEFDAERLEVVRERLSEYQGLAKKYGGSVEAVIEHRTRIGREHETATNFDAAIERLEKAMEESCASLTELAFRLSDERVANATKVQNAVVSELSSLGIRKPEFEVQVERVEDKDGWVWSRWESSAPVKYRASARGIDRVEFLISTNVGESVKPLAKVASGGEVSRIMLALKTILAKSDAFPILVFDEIDAGISGAISQKVGESLRDLAVGHQILCITHLPQVAAMADLHFVVEKTVAGQRTRTSIRRLGDKERTEEVASLMSGAEITEASLQSARELMEIASRADVKEPVKQVSNS